MRRSTRHVVIVLVGVVLMATSCLGVVHGVRAGVAQVVYRLTKYGGAKTPDVEMAARSCQDAHALYPHNYYLCAWIGELAYYRRFDEFNGTLQSDRVKLARLWCDRGLALNFHNQQLRALKANLLALESSAEAADYWEKYVNWDFWNPHHHKMLVEFHAKTGDYDKAMDSLELIKGSPYYDEARKRFQEILAGHMRMPSALVPGPVPNPSTKKPVVPPAVP